MTVFAACLFALAGLASALTLATSLRRHGADALELRAQLRACPETTTLCWKVIERVPSPALALLRKDLLLRKDSAVRPAHRPAVTQDWSLDWPALERAA